MVASDGVVQLSNHLKCSKLSSVMVHFTLVFQTPAVYKCSAGWVIRQHYMLTGQVVRPPFAIRTTKVGFYTNVCKTMLDVFDDRTIRVVMRLLWCLQPSLIPGLNFQGKTKEKTCPHLLALRGLATAFTMIPRSSKATAQEKPGEWSMDVEARWQTPRVQRGSNVPAYVEEAFPLKTLIWIPKDLLHDLTYVKWPSSPVY